jgi:hypothetical protein
MLGQTERTTTTVKPPVGVFGCARVDFANIASPEAPPVTDGAFFAYRTPLRAGSVERNAVP